MVPVPTLKASVHFNMMIVPTLALEGGWEQGTRPGALVVSGLQLQSWLALGPPNLEPKSQGR